MKQSGSLHVFCLFLFKYNMIGFCCDNKSYKLCTSEPFDYRLAVVVVVTVRIPCETAGMVVPGFLHRGPAYRPAGCGRGVAPDSVRRWHGPAVMEVMMGRHSVECRHLG